MGPFTDGWNLRQHRLLEPAALFQLNAAEK